MKLRKFSDTKKSARKQFSKNEWWRGVEGVRMIWHGEWSDPELKSEDPKWGNTANYWDVEDTLWQEFCEFMKEEHGVDPKLMGEDKYEDRFNEWLQENNYRVHECIYEESDEFKGYSAKRRSCKSTRKFSARRRPARKQFGGNSDNWSKYIFEIETKLKSGRIRTEHINADSEEEAWKIYDRKHKGQNISEENMWIADSYLA